MEWMRKILLLVILGSCSNKNVRELQRLEIESEIAKNSVQTFNCIHTDLSERLDFRVDSKRFQQDEYQDSCVIDVTVRSKKSGQIIDSIGYTTIIDNIYEIFRNCNETRLLTTKKNKEIVIQDNYAGEFIVADFNFDFREDLACIRNRGNRGASYNYFIQDENGKFHLDDFLSDTMIYFPIKIDKAKKTLTTLVHANALEQGEKVYEHKDKYWKMKSHRHLPHP